MPIFKTCHWLDECVQIMYVYSYIFIDICQMCVFEKHCVFLCKKLCICIYLQKMMYIYIYIHRHMSDVRLWIYVHVSIYIWVYMYVHIRLHIYIFNVYVYVYVYVFIRIVILHRTSDTYSVWLATHVSCCIVILHI